MKALAPIVLLIAVAAPPASDDPPPIEWFFDLASFDDAIAAEAMVRIGERWVDGYASMVVDLARFARPREDARSADVSGATPRPDPQGLTHAPQYPGAQFATVSGGRDHPTTRIRARLVRFLQQRTGQRLGDDLDRWRRWTWERGGEPHPDLLAFKAGLYERLDPLMGMFFAPGTSATIRLDEIEWAGARTNDFPPLVEPSRTGAAEARHMRDGHPVLGVSIDGHARAYPIRILAWHQIVHDRVGSRDIILAYCPISGVAAAYDARVDGAPLRFGTSGLVYRTAVLMFDEGARSLWTTLGGEAVVGDMSERRAALTPLPLVVTTWGDWRRRHAATTVLAAETGHPFAYSEGAVSREHLERAGLGFPVPHESRALGRHTSVLGIRPRDDGRRDAVAIPVRGPGRHPLRLIEVNGRRIVVLTTREGAPLLFDAGAVRFVDREPGGRLRDADGWVWDVTDDALVDTRDPARRLLRVPAAHASWEAWHAYYPHTAIAR
jgi:hypothetical protein